MKPKKSRKDAAKAVRDALASHEAAVALPRRKKRTKRERRARLKKGPWSGGPPFGREFFAETLGKMVQACPCADGHGPLVNVFLGDGAVLDVAGVVSLHERYAVVAAYEGKGADGVERTKDDLGFEAFPYDLVVRASVRSAARTGGRFGFGSFMTAKAEPDEKAKSGSTPPES